MPAIDPLSFFLWKNPRLLVDVRPTAAFSKGSLDNARSIPEDQYSSHEDLLKEIKNLQREGLLHLIDRDGTASEYISHGAPIKYLKGGYEAFKIWRDLAFDAGPPLYLLGGYSGAGKTQFLEHLENNYHQVINLESLSGHKGSVFGSIHSQPLHDRFQNSLLNLWYSMETNAPVWIEEKGPFLGQVGLPSSLYQKMLQAPMIHLDVPFEQRLIHIMRTYEFFDEDNFRPSLQSLEERMGTSQNHKALHFHDTGQKEKCIELLLRYYDRAYEKRREKYWSGKIIHINHAHDDIPATLEKIEVALKKKPRSLTTGKPIPKN
jgi:tRNA 2-selenouridine synthase SelU